MSDTDTATKKPEPFEVARWIEEEKAAREWYRSVCSADGIHVIRGGRQYPIESDYSAAIALLAERARARLAWQIERLNALGMCCRPID